MHYCTLVRWHWMQEHVHLHMSLSELHESLSVKDCGGNHMHCASPFRRDNRVVWASRCVTEDNYGITRVNQWNINYGVHSQGCVVPGKLGLEVVRRLCSGCISCSAVKEESVIKIHQANELS